MWLDAKQLGEGGCPSLLSITVINIMTKSNVGRRGFVSFHNSQSIMKEIQGRVLRQELKQKPQRNVSYRPDAFGSTSF